jgi:serine/threonine protein kinase
MLSTEAPAPIAAQLKDQVRAFLQALKNGDYDAVWHERITPEAASLLSATVWPSYAHRANKIDALLTTKIEAFPDVPIHQGLALAFQRDVEEVRTGFFRGVANSFEKMGWYDFSEDDSVVFLEEDGAIFLASTQKTKLLMPLLAVRGGDYAVDFECLHLFSMALSASLLTSIAERAEQLDLRVEAAAYWKLAAALLPGYERVGRLYLGHPAVRPHVTARRRDDLAREVELSQAAHDRVRPQPAPGSAPGLGATPDATGRHRVAGGPRESRDWGGGSVFGTRAAVPPRGGRDTTIADTLRASEARVPERADGPPRSAQELLARYARGERDFSGAELADARLDGAVLIGANLRGANLQGASFHRADFGDADLREVVLDDYNGLPANLRGCKISRGNGWVGRWDVQKLLAWHGLGAIITDLDALPEIDRARFAESTSPAPAPREVASPRTSLEARLDNVKAAAVAVGPSAQAHGTMSMEGMSVNADTVIFTAVSTSAPNQPDAVPRAAVERLALQTVLEGRTGKYVIAELLEAGGMGTVYRAKRQRDGMKVAIKLHGSHLSAATSAQERFEQEIAVALTFDHPNVVKALDTGAHYGHRFLVSEFLSGGTVAQRIAKKEYSDDEAFGWCRNLIEGVLYLHKNGFVHRDIKPSNLLLSAEGPLKIADFGIVRDLASRAALTLTGEQIGSAMYISPRQRQQAHEAGPEDDAYSTCCCLYEILSRQLIRPFMPSLREATGGAISKLVSDLVMECLGEPNNTCLSELHRCFTPSESGDYLLVFGTREAGATDLRVLLVNDDPATMGGFTDLCRVAGVALEYAFTVEDAKKAIAAWNPSVVVSDLSHFFAGTRRTSRAAFELLEWAHEQQLMLSVAITAGELTLARREEADALGALGICDNLAELVQLIERATDSRVFPHVPAGTPLERAIDLKLPRAHYGAPLPPPPAQASPGASLAGQLEVEFSRRLSQAEHPEGTAHVGSQLVVREKTAQIGPFGPPVPQISDGPMAAPGQIRRLEVNSSRPPGRQLSKGQRELLKRERPDLETRIEEARDDAASSRRGLQVAVGVTVVALLAAWVLPGNGSVSRISRCQRGDYASCVAIARQWDDGNHSQEAAQALTTACENLHEACACAGLGILFLNQGLYGPDGPKRAPGYCATASQMNPNWRNECPNESYFRFPGAVPPECDWHDARPR